ncbi:hypothetical protein V1264_002614 [Littorina saxatilis]|uniref:Fucolectin tachylectin-4 pentraxin-1 domain-containing protein n=1 Tax=Littorina saxatilis TaxID=31220 RepID=A0AAN9G7N1_9CAEN
MLKALHVVSVGTDRGEQNMTKAELRGQGTEVTPMRNAAVTVKDEWSRRPPGMAVEEDDKRWSHDTGNTTTNTTLLYPPAQHHDTGNNTTNTTLLYPPAQHHNTGNSTTNTTLLYPPAQHHSDSSNAPETPNPAALTDHRLEDWSGNLFDKSSVTPGVRDTEEERGSAGKLSDMTSDDNGTGEERSWSGNPSDKSSMTSDGRDTGEKRSWSDTTPQKALTTSRPALEAEATREVTKQHHWEDAARDSTTTARRKEDARQRMEWLKTMNHNERMEQLKTMHLNVSSARRDDEAERRGVTKRSWEHSDELAQRKMRQAIYGDTEIDKSYEKWDCVCPRCRSPRKRHNLANVAYKKPSFQRSLLENLAGPCGGNNGNDDFILNFTREYNNGYHSDEHDYRAWWWVDLNDFYTISTVTITLRNENWKVDYNRNYNTVVTINGEVCYEFGTDDAVLRSLNFRNDYNCKTPIRGRYVMMQKEEFPPGRDEWYFLIFMELSIYACLPGHSWELSKNRCAPCGSPCNYICDNLYGCNFIENYNIAFKKAIEMSSEDYGNAESTVDGRTDSRLHYMECTASGTKAGQTFHPYWRVDLNGDYLVNSVVVKPRIDCCANKMKNLNVLVQNRTTDLARVTEHGSSDLCTHWEGTFQNGQEIKFTCTSQMLGKYVSLQTIRPSQMLLCEVQVFGYPVTVLGPGGECNRLLTTICQEGLECDRGKCKVSPGRTCLQTEWRQHCRSGSICYAGVCKLVAGADCRAHQGSCARGTECDSTSGYKCQKSIHKTCSQTNQCARYTEGIECDHLKQCGGKGLGVTCVNKECVAGAKCENSKCQCTAGVSTASGKICGKNDFNCSLFPICGKIVCNSVLCPIIMW